MWRWEGQVKGGTMAPLDIAVIGWCISGDGVMGCWARLHYQYWLCAAQSVGREEQHSVNRVKLVTSLG